MEIRDDGFDIHEIETAFYNGKIVATDYGLLQSSDKPELT
jgi:hypothetical protein